MFDAIRKEIADEYAQPHAKPWIVGFSGGKDSTVVAHLVVEHLLSIPRSYRIRTVHVVANDTLVESPLVIGHIREAWLRSTALRLPSGSQSWLVAIRNDPERRLARRRNGRFTISKKGVFVPGPFNMATRKEILDRLVDLQNETRMPLISDAEVQQIRLLWVDDVLVSTERSSREQRLAVAELT